MNADGRLKRRRSERHSGEVDTPDCGLGWKENEGRSTLRVHSRKNVKKEPIMLRPATDEDEAFVNDLFSTQ